jgi:hypothetical protein
MREPTPSRISSFTPPPNPARAHGSKNLSLAITSLSSVFVRFLIQIGLVLPP